MEDSYPQFSTTTPLSPTGSLLRGWRPSLAALFHQFRGSSDRDYLLKEDFSEVFLEPSDLDKAFSELDKDGDGRITLEEFMAGFATFLRQSQSRRPTMTDTALDPGGFRRKGSVRRSVRKRPVPEVFFETSDTTVDDDKKKPTVAFKSSLKPLGTRTQYVSVRCLFLALCLICTKKYNTLLRQPVNKDNYYTTMYNDVWYVMLISNFLDDRISAKF